MTVSPAGRFAIVKLAAAVLLVMPAAEAQTPGTAPPIAPGQWRITVTVKTIDIPGAPPGIGKAMLGEPRSYTECVTPEQAANGPREMLKGGADCSTLDYSLTGGRLTAQMQCIVPGGTASARATGTFNATRFSATSTASVSGRIAMRVTSSVAGQRIGECGA